MARGGSISHDDRFSGKDKNTRLIWELRVSKRCVGSETI